MNQFFSRYFFIVMILLSFFILISSFLYRYLYKPGAPVKSTVQTVQTQTRIFKESTSEAAIGGAGKPAGKGITSSTVEAVSK